MFDKICTKLSLHTRAARVVYFSSFFFILSVTVIAVVFFLEPQATVPPPAVELFSARMLGAEFSQEFGAEAQRYFLLVTEIAAEGDGLLQSYHFLRSDGSRSVITAGEARRQFVQLSEMWDAESAPLLGSENVWVRAVAEDIDEALTLALAGLSGWSPFINQRLVVARGLFHDLDSVLLAAEKDDRYYGATRLGKLVEKELLP